MIVVETCPVCGHDITEMTICTYPPIPVKECHNCGWRWEGEREEIVRVPFQDDTQADDLLQRIEYSEKYNGECPQWVKNLIKEVAKESDIRNNLRDRT